MKTPRKLMCVEDDADIRTILEFSLVQLGGYEVRMCSSGEEALACWADFNPDMLLLDVMMPGLSGPQTLAMLHEQGLPPETRVVFLTAKAMRDELEALTKHGAAGIIVKPFDPVRLPTDILLYWPQAYTSSDPATTA